MKKLSLDNFRKWMEEQTLGLNHENSHLAKYIGTEVQSKISSDHLVKKISYCEGNIEEVIEDFINYGGTIVDIKSNEFLIEVSSGGFRIPKYYVKKSIETS